MQATPSSEPSRTTTAPTRPGPVFWRAALSVPRSTISGSTTAMVSRRLPRGATWTLPPSRLRTAQAMRQQPPARVQLDPRPPRRQAPYVLSLPAVGQTRD
ncbi:hypothetical protein CCHR01_00286 [Colletotrichum chrysophilum]|uniref:Uncharacterized protein n=1 Tax=Colletotrichum chrysophilum TaxID=1836956 RepID=A0AAD9B0T8_9PEZI|nr:hypothetical protein CCHR01_00286 [Colletotrichum chrysophilum]